VTLAGSLGSVVFGVWLAIMILSPAPMLASIRPDSYFPLLLHVLGAMTLVGVVAAGVVTELVVARSEESALLRRLVAIWAMGAKPT
jgi:hypothetical protein